VLHGIYCVKNGVKNDVKSFVENCVKKSVKKRAFTLGHAAIHAPFHILFHASLHGAYDVDDGKGREGDVKRGVNNDVKNDVKRSVKDNARKRGIVCESAIPVMAFSEKAPAFTHGYIPCSRGRTRGRRRN